MVKKVTSINIGDKVKIINPQFFKRCGYPLSLEKAVDHVRDNYNKEIVDLLKSITEIPETYYFKNIPLNHYNKNNIIKEFALAYMKAKNYGGNTREIETFTAEEYTNLVFTVIDKKIVKTGIYSKSHGGLDDYNPPQLINQKSHIILYLDHSINIPCIKFNENIRGITQQQFMKIESCNVEKV